MLRRFLRLIRAGQIALLFALLATSASSSWAATFNLSYDELGRLVGVVDDGGNTASYNYDALGNILSIARGNGAVSVTSFAPSSGQVGTSVTISGYGFSSVANQNTVAFNGTAAVVASATSSRLVVTVPSGATTGPISVTSPNGSATSANAFSVVAGQAPTIAGFSPTIAPPGTAVTVNGTNFQTAVSEDSLTLNTRSVRVATATATTLGFTVPTASSSGHLAVTTPYGQATSSQDLFVPPGTHVPADVGATGRMTIGSAQTVTLSTANKIGMTLFDATGGQRVSLTITGSTFGSCGSGSIQILNTDGSVIGSTNLCNGSFFGAIALPVTASYTILVSPATNTTGSVTFTLDNVPPDATGTIAVDGGASTLTVTVPTQNGSLTFTGNASQRVSLYLTEDSSLSSACSYISIVNPDGTFLVGKLLFCGGGYYSDLLTLPATGTYTIKLDPSGRNTGTATFTLSSVPPDATGTIAVDGGAATLTITAPAQNGSLTFAGNASQRVSLYLTEDSSLRSVCNYLSIVNPDGTFLLGKTLFCGATYTSNALTLPATGTYAIKLDPSGRNTGTATFTLTSQ